MFSMATPVRNSVILNLLVTACLSHFGRVQGSCGGDGVVTVNSSVFDEVEGCYTQSNYTSLQRNIYTNNGGAVEPGETLGILGSFVSAAISINFFSRAECFVELLSLFLALY